MGLLLRLTIFAVLLVGANAIPFCPGIHEQYTDCVGQCQSSCENPNPPCGGGDYSNCHGGCDCEPGYLRNEIGVCVPSRSCLKKPKKCGPNEKLSKCVPICAPTCDRPRANCGKDCGEELACVCKEGFVRDEYDNCIPIDMCPGEKLCGKNEAWSNATCVKPVPCQQPRCSDYNVPAYCATYCVPGGGCVCKLGFYRTKSGKCVEKDQCPIDDDDDDDDCDDDDCEYDDDDDDYDDKIDCEDNCGGCDCMKRRK